MKKFIISSISCLVALSLFVMTACQKEETKEDEKIITEGFVDLGLTSGTKWKATNEGDGYYTYSEAHQKFGKSIPDTAQFMELVRECTWTWVDGEGYKIKGSNGKTIMLPCAGFSDCDNNVYSVGAEGFYWTSKPLGPEREFRFGFNKTGSNINYILRCYHASVRLVE